MLSFHLRNLNLKCRSCSTFSSVLTLGKKSQLGGTKSNQSYESAEYDQDEHRLHDTDLKKNDKQAKQENFTKSSHGWDTSWPGSVQHDAHEPTDKLNDLSYAKSFRRNRKEKWGNGMGWEDQTNFSRAGKGQQKHPKPWRYNKARWDEKDSEEEDHRNANWGRADSDRDSDARKWQKFSRPAKMLSSHKPSLKTENSHPHWDRKHSLPQHTRPQSDELSFPFLSTTDRPSDKPRGKRIRKKEKLGFIELEPALSDPDAEQLLYGLHPVSLALTSDRRQVRRIYHRAGPADGRLSRLLAECAARGISAAPLPAAQLDRIAGGTGVHQGVCARVSPLLPQSVDELLAQAGIPPLAGGSLSTVETEDRRTAESSFWSGEGDLTGTGRERETRSAQDTDGQLLNTSLKSKPGQSRDQCQDTHEPSNKMIADPEKQTEVRPTDISSVGELPRRSTQRRRVWLMLDRVQDPMNFGSIIRSSYFLGVDAIIIPDKNSCPLSPTVSKASAGTLELFPVYSVPADSCRQLLQLLANRRWQLLAAAAEAGSTGQAAADISTDTDTLLVVGNEGSGVAPTLAELCRPWTVPPQRVLADGVESLNVGVATGILLSRLIPTR